MRRIRVQYSPMGQRWAVDLVGVEGLPATVSELGDVTISRDERGRVTSIVIDAVRLESDVIETITEEFGREIADLMAEPSDDEIDEVFIVDDQPGSAVTRGDSPRAGAPMIVLPDEPGVPAPVDGDRFRIVVHVDTHKVEGVLEHDPASARIRIEIDVTQDGQPLWVRVAEGESGAILALAPLQNSGEDSSAVDMAFGLSVPMQALHVSVSDEPLADPGDRNDRRRRWARDLETLATKRARRLRADASTLFERAAGVHENVGDREAAERCRAEARRARRRRRWFGGLGATVAVGILGGLGFVLGRSESVAPDSVVAAVSTDPPATDGPEFVGPPEPGPADLVFDDERQAQVLVTGDVNLRPGDRLEFVVRARIVSVSTFERLVDCVGAEGGNSVFGGDGPMYQPIFVPVLENLSDPEAGSRAFAPFAVERSVDTYFVLPGACQETWVVDGQRFDARSVASYTPYTVTLDLPDDLEPGSWRLRLVWESVEGQARSGDDITIRIVD